MVAVAAPDAVAAVPPCAAGVAVLFERAGSYNDGTSQSVVLLGRNVDVETCSVPGLPKLLFEDEAGRTLAVLRQTPPGMLRGR